MMQYEMSLKRTKMGSLLKGYMVFLLIADCLIRDFHIRFTSPAGDDVQLSMQL